MDKLKNKVHIKLFAYFYMMLFSAYAISEQADKYYQPANPVFLQNYDWVKLTSDEWLKGDIISMYDETLEFDSEELDLQTIDWEDVAELRSKEWQSILMFDGTIAEGNIVVKDGKLFLVKNGKTTEYQLNQLLSIASSGENERDLWDGYANIGLNLRDGNTVQIDYTLSLGLQRRSASTRFKVDYTNDYSRYQDQETEIYTVTADSQRLTSSFDWFFDPKIYFRAVDFEYTSDEFLNLKYRIHYGIAFGYHLIDTSKTSWDINIGPSYQKTKYLDVLDTEKDVESSGGVTIGTDYTIEVTDDIDYDFSYNIQMVDDASGGNIHYLETGVEFELVSDFDLDITLYVDHTEAPKPDSEGVIPDKTDIRVVVGLGYEF